MENVSYLSHYFFTSDLICGPPPTKSTTTQRTSTRQPEPLPTIVTSVIGSQPDVLPGKRKNPPRRRNGLVEQNSNAFLNKGRRLIPQGSKKSSQYDSNKSPNPPVKKFNSQSGVYLSNHNICYLEIYKCKNVK